MSPKPSALSFSFDDIADVDAALSMMELKFSRENALSEAERRRLVTTGDKSDALCRQVLMALALCPLVLPPGFGPNASPQDPEQNGALHQRFLNVLDLFDRARVGEFASETPGQSSAIHRHFRA